MSEDVSLIILTTRDVGRGGLSSLRCTQVGRELPDISRKENPIWLVSFDPNSGKCFCFSFRLCLQNDVACSKVFLKHVTATVVRRWSSRVCLKSLKNHYHILVAHNGLYQVTQELMDFGKLPPDGAKANSVQRF